MELLREAGPAGYAVIAATCLAVGWMLLLAALPLGRLRPPAPLLALAPAGVVTVGALGALYGHALTEAAVGLASPDLAFVLRASGARTALIPLGMAVFASTGLCLLGAVAVAAGNIARAEEGRWTPIHALLAVPGLLALPLALVPGWGDAFASVCLAGSVLVGVFAMCVGALRIGKKDDLRRMASGRALVATFVTAAPLTLAIGRWVGMARERAELFTVASWRDLPELLAFRSADLAWGIGADVGAAILLGLAGLLTVTPVLKGLVDGRSSVGALFTAFLAVVPAALVAPALMPVFELTVPDPVAERVRQHASLGVELVAYPGDPWDPATTTLTVGVYWLWRDDTRLAPYKDGRLMGDALDERGRVAGLRDLPAGSVNLEIDRRTDLRRVLPVIETLRGIGADPTAICLVVRDPEGAPSCAHVRFDPPDAASTHVLLESAETLVIRGTTPEPVDAAALADVLAGAEGAVALHVRPEISTQRWLDAVFALRSATGSWPIAVLD